MAVWIQLPTIAVVDADPQSSQTLQAALANRFRLITATTSEAALRMANGLSIWLWLIAAQLPDISGAEFCRLLRARDPGARVVVIGEAETPDDEVECRTAGVTYYFCKPLDLCLFNALVDRFANFGPCMKRRSQTRVASCGDMTRGISSRASAAAMGKGHLL